MSVTKKLALIINKKLFYFLAFLVATIIATYFMPEAIATIWYIILLIAYYKSNDEPFWLAFFLTVSDGFVSFLGSYSILITLIPGQPGIDIAQLYVLIALVKIYKQKEQGKPYYSKWTKVLMIYTVFLVFIGIINGLNGATNVYFRIVKFIIPLILFYTTPRLMKSIKDYEIFFGLIFVVFILGFVTQVFTVYTGFSPAGNLKIFEEEEAEAGRNFRSFYNPSITLLSLFGSIFFLSLKNNTKFSKNFLYTIIGMTFFMAFLSATRGWIICIGLVIILFFVIVQKGKKLVPMSLLFIALILIGLTNDKIKNQITFSIERFMTLEALAGGDETANGSLARLSERGPKIISLWEVHPVFGCGYSNVFLENSDPHVGNQNLLMHSGIVGFSLILLFFVYFLNEMFGINKRLPSKSNYKNASLTFVVFWVGYFFLHSTSGQQFAYGGLPAHIFPQAIFLAMSSVLFNVINDKQPFHEV